MTAEELLLPRVKHIAPYPLSRMYFNVGDILIFDGFSYKPMGINPHGISMAKDLIESYPHIFRPMDWWEERREMDMPMYLKHKRFFYIHKVVQWGSANANNDPLYTFYGINGELMADRCNESLPATEDEYNAKLYAQT